MARSYELLIHTSFQTQAREVVAKDPDIEGPLTTSLAEIQANPIPGTMQGVLRRRLKGVIHKKHVGGKGGHRLLYLQPLGSIYIIPVYVSPNPRSTFSWDDIDWESICEPFYNDFMNKNYKAFINFKPK